MEALMRYRGAKSRDPAVAAWFASPHDEMRRLAEPWFAAMRGCGPDVRELLHENCPTACVEDAPFGYVAAFRSHVNVGFHLGVFLPDPAGLLEGTGKRMRHMKVRWGEPVNEKALGVLIQAAYADLKIRLTAG